MYDDISVKCFGSCPNTIFEFIKSSVKNKLHNFTTFVLLYHNQPKK